MINYKFNMKVLPYILKRKNTIRRKSCSQDSDFRQRIFSTILFYWRIARCTL